MSDFPGQVNNRSFYYFSALSQNWKDQLPTSNWLLLLIGDSRDEDLMNEIARASLENNVAYVSTLGKEAEWIHDWFDEVAAIRSLPAKAEEPITTFHDDFEEGVWFAFHAAFGKTEIGKVVCVDFTGAHQSKLEKILASF
ncbi:hypothetical protein [Halocola ammonii]